MSGITETVCELSGLHSSDSRMASSEEAVRASPTDESGHSSETVSGTARKKGKTRKDKTKVARKTASLACKPKPKPKKDLTSDVDNEQWIEWMLTFPGQMKNRRAIHHGASRLGRQFPELKSVLKTLKRLLIYPVEETKHATVRKYVQERILDVILRADILGISPSIDHIDRMMKLRPLIERTPELWPESLKMMFLLVDPMTQPPSQIQTLPLPIDWSTIRSWRPWIRDANPQVLKDKENGDLYTELHHRVARAWLREVLIMFETPLPGILTGLNHFTKITEGAAPEVLWCKLQEFITLYALFLRWLDKKATNAEARSVPEAPMPLVLQGEVVPNSIAMTELVASEPPSLDTGN